MRLHLQIHFEQPADQGSGPPPSQPASPAPAAPSPEPGKSENSFRDDVTDWMSDIDERINALGRAVRELVGATAQQITGKPAPAAEPQQTVIEPNKDVAKEAAQASKKKGGGLFW